MTLDIDKAKDYLRSVRIPFNQKDEIHVDGDLSELKGHLLQYGGKGQTIHFVILARTNGIFVDWRYACGKARIDKVSSLMS